MSRERALPRRTPIALALLAGLGACTESTAGVTIVTLPASADVDPGVVALVEEHVEQVEKNPKDAQAHARLGLAYEANSMWDLAARCYRTALDLSPEDNQWRYRLAIVQRNGGDLESALATMKEVARIAQRNAAVQVRLGDLLLEAGDVDAARTAFETGLTVGPMFAEPLVGLARVHLRQGDAEKAVPLLEQAIGMDPAYRHAYSVLGQALGELGRDEDAAQNLQRGAGSTPRYPPDAHDATLRSLVAGFGPRMARIEELTESGQLDVALEEGKKLAEQHLDDPRVMTQLGRILNEMGAFQDATLPLQRAITLKEDDYAPHVELARALVNLDALDEALAHARRAVELAPDVGVAHYMLGVVLTQRGEAQPAFEALSAAHAKGFENPQLYYLLAQHYATSDPAEMLKFAELAVKAAPQSAHTHLLLSQAYRQSGNAEAARVAFDTAKQLAPEDPFVKQMEATFGESDGR